MPEIKNIKKSELKTGHSSQLLGRLFGDVSPFSKIIDGGILTLNEKYPDKDFSRVFEEMRTRMIPLMPMALYSAMTKDLGKKPDKIILEGVGICVFPTGTFDDIVDEMPRDRVVCATLLYGGSIATSEGIGVLINKKKTDAAVALLESINQNYFGQNKIVDILWQRKEITTEEYLEGIRQIVAFTSIGLMTAIADARMPELKERVMEFSDGYGIPIQLIDDMREVEEDRRAGYMSLPRMEGEPFTESFEIAFSKLEKARKSLLPEWKNLERIISNTEQLLREMQNEYS